MRLWILSLSIVYSATFYSAAAVAAGTPALGTAAGATPSAATPAANEGRFALGLSSLFAFGGLSVDDAKLADLLVGGHDPSRNGFTVQNVEVIASGAVDPYFDAQVNAILIVDAAGDTLLELEEGFLRTRALPAGLQVKAGQYYTEFGRQNPQHPHMWAFVDQPVVLSRFFGRDNLRSSGARVAWLTPLPWFWNSHSARRTRPAKRSRVFSGHRTRSSAGTRSSTAAARAGSANCCSPHVG